MIQWKDKNGPVRMLEHPRGPNHNTRWSVIVMAENQPTLFEIPEWEIVPDTDGDLQVNDFGEIRKTPRICDACGENIPSARKKGAKFCSNSCWQIKYKLLKKGYSATKSQVRYWKLPARCIVCNVPMPRSSRKKFCSSRCSQLKYSDARKSDGLEINRLKIAERDNWTCYLCGKPINPHDLHPLPGALQIDHLLPIFPAGGFAGGGNDLFNLAATHGNCNISKSNRIIELAMKKLLANIEVWNGPIQKEYLAALEATFMPNSA